MTTPLSELLAQVPTLNDPTEPYAFEAVGDTITGRWDIVHAKFLELRGVGTIDEDYVIVVEFDENKGTYDLTESKKESQSEVTADDGKVGFSFGKSTFSGKSTSKSFNFQAGGVYNTPEGNSLTLTYKFETSRIKEPLFTFLEGNGWTRKKGFLGGLFGR